jgi:phosphate transport system substrate-binding protein
MILGRGGLLALVGCTLVTTSPAVSGRPAVLEGSAPSILSGLVRRWTIDFERSEPAIQVDVPPPYDPPQAALSPRLAAFLQGQSDFAFLSRKMSDRDVLTFRQVHHYDPLVIPVAGGSWSSFGLVDPLAVVVNSRNPISGISFAQLDAIFSKSRRRGHAAVRTWRQLGVRALSGRPIHLAGGGSWTGEDSARAGVFRERVLLGGSWRDDPEAAASGTEKEVPARVAADPLAIGFTGLGHLIPGTRAVPLASGRSSSYVKPTFEAVASGKYPLARTIDLVVAREPGTCLTRELRTFVRYLLSPRGQKVVTNEGHLLPLTSVQARLSWLRASSCS